MTVPSRTPWMDPEESTDPSLLTRARAAKSKFLRQMFQVDVEALHMGTVHYHCLPVTWDRGP